MKKIILLGRYNESEILSGPEKIAKRIFHYLLLRNYNIIFCDFYFKDRKNATLLNRLFGFEKLNENVFRTGIFKLLLLTISKDVKIIHVLTLERYQIILFLLKKLLRIHIITTLHACVKYELANSVNKFNWLQKLKLNSLEKLAISKSDELVLVSNLLKKILMKYYDLSKKNLSIIYHAVDRDFYQNKIEMNFTNPLKIIFYNSSQYINRDLYMVYCALLELNDINIQLFVIGDNDENVTSKNNVNVIYKNYMSKSDLINFLKDKQILIKGFTFDSFPLFAAECMAMGKIVILNYNIGVSELIENCVNGFICNNYDEIIMTIKNLYNNKSLVNKISENATKIYSILNWDNVIKHYIDLYERV